ncbi:High-affinity nitrate transporter 2.1 [Entophlyctis luteolus]|nr:High-affinity nitrate transporter 2.1 [Entophlyctis luteolus]KAJ3388525.1 High-affinity nitrate transporter 2.1 [Entophlyctis sp. JEL0112]
MSIILVLGSIPQAFSVLSTNSAGIIASRVFISIFGAAFVPCQYWTTAFFSPEIVGSANAIVAGWGNMGAGVTNLVIPRIFNLFYYDIGLSRSLSWKLTVGVVPVVLILIIAFVCWRFGKDSPDPEFVETPSKTMNVNGKLVEIDKHIINPAARTHTVVYLLYKTFLIPAVPILMIHYACSFGVELSLDGAIGNYFIDEFGVDQSTASLFSGLFGLMNLFTRATGGVVSDLMARRFGQIGRIYWHFVIFGISTVSLIAFSYVRDISSSLALLVVFSFAVEANCGSTFGLVPFVGPFMGSTSGLVGAGGNIGAALFNVLLASYVNDTRTAFFWMGVSVGIGGFLACFLLVVNGEYILKPLFEKPEIATEDYALEMRPPRHQRS